jgi:hypothetical protein
MLSAYVRAGTREPRVRNPRLFPRSLSEERSDETKRGDRPRASAPRIGSLRSLDDREGFVFRSLSEERSDESKRGDRRRGGTFPGR